MPNVAQDFLIVTERVNQLERKLSDVQKEYRRLKQAAGEATAEMKSGAEKAGKAAQFMSNPVAAANRRTKDSTDLLNRQRFALFQVTSGAQDAAIAFQQMGFTTQGWSMAARGASNNLGVMLSTMGPLAAIGGTIALAVGPPFVAFLYNLATGAEFAAARVDNVGKSAEQASTRLKGMQESLKGVEETQRSLQKAMMPEAEQQAQSKFEKERAETLREEIRQRGPEFEIAKSRFVREQVEAVTGPEVEAAKIRQARQRSEEMRMMREARPSLAWEAMHAVSPFREALRERETLRRQKALAEQLQRYKTPEEVDQALAEDRLEFGKSEAELIKSRLRTEKNTADVSEKVLGVNKKVMSELEDKISRGEVPSGFPISQERIDVETENRVREKEHAELVKKHQESRKRLDSARDQEALDRLQERARPLQEELKTLGLSNRERQRLGLERMTKRQIEQRRTDIGQELESIHGEQEGIRIGGRERERTRRGYTVGDVGGAVGGGAGPRSLLDLPARSDQSVAEQTRVLSSVIKSLAVAPVFNRNAQL